MSIYTRYVSDADVPQSHSQSGQIRLRPLSGQFDVFNNPSTNLSSAPRDLDFWKEAFSRSAFYSGHDPLLFGHVITLVYKNSASKLSAVSITKYGFNVYESLLLDESSRFWPACQNLLSQHRSSSVRKALAISNLKNYNKLWNNRGTLDFSTSWDETNAGALASSMQQIDESACEALGMRLLSMGLLQESNIASLSVDVVYDTVCVSAKTVEENNKLVTILGTQMEQLFDPLLEYSPQSLNYVYTPCAPGTDAYAGVPEITSIIEELVSVQTNYTMELVGILQDFIIPLRVKVLSDMSSTTLGVMKVNVVFPPTIDEVTRINCILNNILKVAAKSGAAEVLRVMASVLPFFYKAFARHQANISAFHSRFTKFLVHNETYSFGNPKINRGSYSPKRLESIVLDSIFELPKLKLIVERLHAAMKTENPEAARGSQITHDLSTIVSTVDAFGRVETVERGKRIFTPSGKLLTEIATGWPKNLQCGWMTRKVLAIYELENLTPDCEHTHEVMIIFSDTVVFLEAVYEEENTMAVSISDVLMNSLINQKALPSYSCFPKLKVRYWCNVESILCKSFVSAQGQCLSFIAYSGDCFQQMDSDEAVYAINYKPLSPDDSVATCNKIMDHVCKAQILHKSTPFHLFKRTDTNLTRFYCAHQYQAYAGEKAKSGIVIVLNLNEEKARAILSDTVSIVISLSFYNEDTVSIVGYNQENTIDISENVPIEMLSGSLRTTFAHCMDIIVHSSNFTRSLIGSNGRILTQLVALAAKKDNLDTRTLDDLVYPNTETPASMEATSAKTAKTEGKQRASLSVGSTTHKPKITSRFLGFIHRLKPKSEKKPKRSSQVPSRNSLQNISNTGIPRGRKQNFNKLYKPSPELYEASTMQSSINDENASLRRISPVVPPKEIMEKSKHRVLSSATNTSSKYSNGSLDVNSRFEFPVQQLGDIQEDTVTDEEVPTDCLFEPLPEDTISENSESELHSQEVAEENHDTLRPIASIEYEYPSANIEDSGSSDNTFQPPHKPAQEKKQHPEPQPQEHVQAGRTADILVQEHVQAGRRADVLVQEQVGTDQKQEKQIDFSEKKQGYPKQRHLSGQRQNVPPQTQIVPAQNKADFHAEAQASPADTNVPTRPQQEKQEKPTESMHTQLKREEAKMWHGKIMDQISVQSSVNSSAKSEQLSAIGQSSKIYAKYRVYNEIPASIFNGDDGANWVAFARDSYSNLHAELQAIRNEDDFAKSLETSMKSLYQRFDSSHETLSVFDVESFIKNSFSNDVANEAEKTDESYESYESLSSNYVREFGLEMDRDFSLNEDSHDGEGETEMEKDPEQIPDTAKNSKTQHITENGSMEQSRTPHNSAEPYKTPNSDSGFNESASNESQNKHRFENHIKILHDSDFTTSSEEYFSSQEFTTALKLGSGFDSVQIASSSSEKTLMNEYLYSMNEETKEYNWVKVHEADNLRDFGSMTYLSDILNGVVEF